MDRRGFLKILGSVAAAAGLGELAHTNRIVKARGDDLIRVDVAMTHTFLASSARPEEAVEMAVEKAKASAEAQAGRMGWCRWKSRIVNWQLADQDCERWQVILEEVV